MFIFCDVKVYDVHSTVICFILLALINGLPEKHWTLRWMCSKTDPISLSL